MDTKKKPNEQAAEQPRMTSARLLATWSLVAPPSWRIPLPKPWLSA